MTQRWLSAARSEHRHPHLSLSNLRTLCLSEQHHRYLRGRGVAAYLRARLHRVLLWLQILLIQRVYMTAPAAPRALAALRSGVFAASQPASSRSRSQQQQQQQQQQQRRCAERSKRPHTPACTPMSALSALRSGDSLVPCWCWQVQKPPPSHAEGAGIVSG